MSQAGRLPPEKPILGLMEEDLIHWLQHRLQHGDRTNVGVGDDAAVFNWRGRQVVTTDTLMDGVDFVLSQCDAQRVGRKALAVNLSDLAAMASRPVSAVVSLVLPCSGGHRLAQDLYEGMLPLAHQFGVDVVGGDTNSWEGPLVIGLTLMGDVVEPGPWLRSGGRVGDQVLVTGHFGGSILGSHFTFEPRVKEALSLLETYQINGATDVSDGLSWDLHNVAKASGCGAVVDLSRVPISAAAHQLAARPSDRLSALRHALCDGEDFELILVASADQADRLIDEQPLGVPVTKIGYLVEELGLWQQTGAGKKVERLKPRGYQHQLDL